MKESNNVQATPKRSRRSRKSSGAGSGDGKPAGTGADTGTGAVKRTLARTTDGTGAGKLGKPTVKPLGTGAEPANGKASEPLGRTASLGEEDTSRLKQISEGDQPASEGSRPRPEPTVNEAKPPIQTTPDIKIIDDTSAAEKNRTAAREGMRRLRASKQAPAKVDAAAIETAQLFLNVLDSLAYTAVGDQGKMLAGEKEVLEPPLARVVARMDERTALLIQTVSDPLAILIGLGAWGSRLMAIRREQSQAADQAARMAAFTPTPQQAAPVTTPTAAPTMPVQNWSGASAKDETIAVPSVEVLAMGIGETI